GAQRLLPRQLAERLLHLLHLRAQEMDLPILAGIRQPVDHRRQALELGAEFGGLAGRRRAAQRALAVARQRGEFPAQPGRQLAVKLLAQGGVAGRVRRMRLLARLEAAVAALEIAGVVARGVAARTPGGGAVPRVVVMGGAAEPAFE